ncbi:hypothetical protein LTR94_038486, partial [Friedmanniomyces endolithicus]
MFLQRNASDPTDFLRIPPGKVLELGEQVTIAKLNIDENPDAPGRYGVRGIPTMILFKGGAPAATK